MTGRKYIPYILLAPLLILYILPLTASMINIILQSLGYFPVLNMYDITFGYLIKALRDEVFVDSLKFSCVSSLITTLLALLIGFIIAYLMSKSKNEGVVHNLLKVPLLIPHFTAAFMIFLIFSQSGFISRILGSLNIISGQEAFPHLVLDKSGIGIILAYAWKEVPFASLVIYTSIKMVSGKFKDTAYNLGASEMQYIWSVLLPLCFPSVLSTFTILFGYNFGAFEVPYLIGPTYPRALPVLGYISYISPNLSDRPYAMAINIIITGMSILLLIMYQKAAKMMKNIEV